MHALLIRLQTNWMRNLLAVLQVAAATAAVSAVLTTVIPALLDRPDAEPNLLRVQYGAESEFGGSYTSIFTVDDVRYLQQEAESVEAVTIISHDFMRLVRVAEERYAVQGLAEVSPGYAQIYDLEFLQGAFFVDSDLDAGTVAPVVISDRLARILFGRENVVGETINLRPDTELMVLMGHMGGPFDKQAILASPGFDLQVVGVFRSNEQSDAFIYQADPHMLVPVGVSDRARMVAAGPVMAMGSAEVKVVGSSVVSVEVAGEEIAMESDEMEISPMPVFGETHYGDLMVKPREGMARQAEQEVAALLRGRVEGRHQGAFLGPRGGEMDVLVSDAGRDRQQFRQYQLQNSLLTGAMGLAALIVAGFAVFTTTMANLAERTRSIGLSRALGATRGRILREVVFESMFLSAIGGVLGALAAYPFGKYVIGPWQPVLSMSWTDVVSAGLVGLLLAVVVGALAAIFPAWNVAQLMPTEALREGRV